MNRDETIELWQRCQEKRGRARDVTRAEGKPQEAALVQQEAASQEWNAWSSALLRERKALEDSGRWEDEAGRWRRKAIADFSAIRFVPRGYTEESQQWADAASTAGITAWRRVLVPARMHKSGDDELRFLEVLSDGSRVDFSDFVFPGGALFESCQFGGDAMFSSACFHEIAAFPDAEFECEAGFVHARFEKSVDFSRTLFRDQATFYKAWFGGLALFEEAALLCYLGQRSRLSFEDASFQDYSSFKRINCEGNASFKQASFDDQTTFEGARFHEIADFTGIEVARSCSLSSVVFSQIPKLNQADFKQAPDLDGIAWPLPSMFARGVAANAAKYRALKRIAIQGHDYEREHMAFVGELRSRRLTEDGWTSAGLWLGMAYDLISDCGRSVWRPFVLWLATIVLFAAVYLGLAVCSTASPSPVPPCANGVVQSLSISTKNALVVLGGDSATRLSGAYACLFGGDTSPPAPASLAFVESLLQRPLSAVLLFLVLLAIRNRFRIK